MEFILHDLPACEPWEYFCPHCKVMQLSYVNILLWGRCNKPITIKGNPGELDLEALRKQYGYPDTTDYAVNRRHD